MLMFLAAATVVAAAPPVTERTPNLYRVPASCRNMPYHVVDRFGRPIPTPLADLPRPSLQYLVDRRIGGCPVITVGRGFAMPAPDQPNPPSSQYRTEPLRPR